MAEIHIHFDGDFEDHMREFGAKVERGVERAMEAAAQSGYDLSMVLAPTGKKLDPRGPTIRGGMYSFSDATSATWGSNAHHAMAQEEGGKRHDQTGDVSFFWEREGRFWDPGKNIIDHPGNPPQPYLRPALEAVVAQFPEELRAFIEAELHG